MRQLRDAKIKPLVETFNADVLDIYAMACGWVLARAHAKVSEVTTTISGYLGSSSRFDEAMGRFAWVTPIRRSATMAPSRPQYGKERSLLIRRASSA